MKTPLEYLMNNMFIIFVGRCNLIDHDNFRIIFLYLLEYKFEISFYVCK